MAVAVLVIIPTANSGALYLGDDLYDYNLYRWYQRQVVENIRQQNQIPAAVRLLQSDRYAEPDDLVAVEVKVEFKRTEHPTVKTHLASREEIVFLHHARTASTDNLPICDGNTHLTQVGSGGSALYSGPGALVQYDLKTNYAKCSQVPLVIDRSCNAKAAVLGFFRDKNTGSLAQQLVTGRPICSIADKSDTKARIRGGTEKRTVKAIDCSDDGYIERVKNDEKPRCVQGGTPSQFRVAAESKTAPSNTKYYTLIRRTSAGGDGAKATWGYFSCPVERYYGIHAFQRSGLSGEVLSYVPHGKEFGVGIGPTGASGRTGSR